MIEDGTTGDAPRNDVSRASGSREGEAGRWQEPAMVHPLSDCLTTSRFDLPMQVSYDHPQRLDARGACAHMAARTISPG